MSEDKKIERGIKICPILTGKKRSKRIDRGRLCDSSS